MLPPFLPIHILAAQPVQTQHRAMAAWISTIHQWCSPGVMKQRLSDVDACREMAEFVSSFLASYARFSFTAATTAQSKALGCDEGMQRDICTLEDAVFDVLLNVSDSPGTFWDMFCVENMLDIARIYGSGVRSMAVRGMIEALLVVSSDQSYPWQQKFRDILDQVPAFLEERRKASDASGGNILEELEEIIDVVVMLLGLLKSCPFLANDMFNRATGGDQSHPPKMLRELCRRHESLSPSETQQLRVAKYAILECIEAVLHACYFDPIDKVSSEMARSNVLEGGSSRAEQGSSSSATTGHSSIDSLVGDLCDTLLWMLEEPETSRDGDGDGDTLDGDACAKDQLLITAPVTVDLDVETDVFRQVGKLNSTLPDPDPRLEYALQTLQHLRKRLERPVESMRDRYERYVLTKTLLEARQLTAASTIPPALQDADSAAKNEAMRVEKIGQVRMVLSDLGEGFVEACLERYTFDMEAVITRLFEADSGGLDADLISLDRAMTRDAWRDVSRPKPVVSVLDERRNIFDGDEFDLFAGNTPDLERVHIGKKERGEAQSELSKASFVSSNKDRILERVRAFEIESDEDRMYNDEYDDTYDDLNEAPAAGDSRFEDETPRPSRHQHAADPGLIHEELLIQLVSTNAAIFQRDATTRRSSPRTRLRQQTGLSDEQIEGWFVMFNRNPRKQRLLDIYSWSGQQQQVPSPADGKPLSSATKPRQQAPSHSQGKPKNDRGDASGKDEHRHKEQHKAKHGNHNRKNASTKKFRGMIAPPE